MSTIDLKTAALADPGSVTPSTVFFGALGGQSDAAPVCISLTALQAALTGLGNPMTEDLQANGFRFLGDDGVAGALTLVATSGVGVGAERIVFKGGNDGADEWANLGRNGGWLGLGVTSPLFRLHVKGTGDNADSGSISAQNTSNTSLALASINVTSATGSGFLCAAPANYTDANIADCVALLTNSDAAHLVLYASHTGQKIKLLSVAGVDIIGTANIAQRSLFINGVAGLYFPDQTSFTGSIAFGNGLRLMSHSAGADGFYNTSGGFEALLSVTTGAALTGFGYGVLRSATSASNNTAFGYSALNALLTTSGNVAIGDYALISGVGVTDCTAVGSQAMRLGVTLVGQTGIGKFALYSDVNGGNNTGVGDSAFRFVNGGTGNSGVGYRVGESLTGVASDNCFFGTGAGVNVSQLATAVNSIAIGASTFTTANNQIVLGNTSITWTILRKGVGIGTGTTALDTTFIPALQIKSTTTDASNPVPLVALNRQNSNTVALLIGVDTNNNPTLAVNGTAALRFGNNLSSTLAFTEYLKIDNGAVTITGNVRATTWARIGSASDPANTTAGDITGVRLSLGNGALSNSDVAALSVLHTSTQTSGTVKTQAVINTISPAGASAAEWRVLLMQNVVSAASINFSAAIQAGWFENRIVNAGTLSGLTGVYMNGLTAGGSAASMGTVTQVVAGLFQSVLSFSNALSSTISAAFGVFVSDAVKGTFTLTSNVGICVDAIDDGTNNTSVLLGTATPPTGNWGIYNASTNANYFAGALQAKAALATPAAASAVAGLTMGSALVGLYWGTGNPTVSAPKGSLYIKTDATTTTTRLWINTDGGTTWTNFTTAA